MVMALRNRLGAVAHQVKNLMRISTDIFKLLIPIALHQLPKFFFLYICQILSQYIGS